LHRIDGVDQLPQLFICTNHTKRRIASLFHLELSSSFFEKRSGVGRLRVAGSETDFDLIAIKLF
jgi:hypothetical protein